MRNKLKIPGDLNVLAQSTPLNPGMSITLTPGIAQISGLPRDNFIKVGYENLAILAAYCEAVTRV